MKPLFILIGIFLATILVQKIVNQRVDYRLAGQIAFSSMLLFTALGHFIFTDGMTAMLPPIIPYRREVVLITGCMEIVFALSLFYPKYRMIIGYLLLVFLVLVTPANIYAAINHIDFQSGSKYGPGLNYLWFRIPLQVLFIIWVFLITLKK